MDEDSACMAPLLSQAEKEEGAGGNIGHDQFSLLSDSHSSSSSSLSLLSSGRDKQPTAQHEDDLVKESYADEPDPQSRNRPSSPSSVSPLSSAEIDYLGERVHCLESEKLSLMIDHNNLIREFNNRMESHLEEIRALKELNNRVNREASDLQDLACYLDDDRQKCRKLAKEWQRFGKYTLAVMRNEVLSYQDKLGALEIRQMELIKENGDLRDLCIYLDGQRINPGNGSVDASSLKYIVCPECAALRKEENGAIPKNSLEASQFALGRIKLSAEYVASLENQVVHLEKEKDTLHKLLLFGSKRSRDKKKKVSFSFPDDDDSSSTTSDVGQLDYPPSFGSIDSFTKVIGHDDAATHGGIPRQQGSMSHVGNHQQSDFNLKRSLSWDHRQSSGQARRINALREKLLLSALETRLRQDGQNLPSVAEGGNSDERRYRSDSDISNPPEHSLHRHNGDAQSTDSSLDLQSPISPPPSTMNVSELFAQAFSKERIFQRGSSSGVMAHPQVVLGSSTLSTVRPSPPPAVGKVSKSMQPPGYEETLHKLNVEDVS